MENLFLYIVWGILTFFSFWGFISLFALLTISSNAWEKSYATRRSSLETFVNDHKAGMKAFLFHFGLTYLEVRDTKIVYFLFSIIAVGISLIFWLIIEISQWTFWFSVSILNLNIVFYLGAKNDMKKFYEGEKKPKDVLPGGSFQNKKFTQFDSEPE